jgi:hypothetical protein
MTERGRSIVVTSLRTYVRDLDVLALSPADAIALVDWFAEVERLAVAGKTIAAGRAVTGEPWKATGERSGADWLARRTATTVGEARDTLTTATNLAAAPGTEDAFRNGELSLKQADAITSAVVADPSSESHLLESARHGSLQQLRDDAARVRASADDGDRHDRIHAQRCWRRWTDRDGARCGSYRMTPEAAAQLEAAAQPFIDAAIDAARREGRHEPTEALAADGLVAMATSPSSPPTARGGRGRRRLKDRRELIGLVDLRALQRGALEPGETCEIAGIGPVPVEVARRVFGDALLRTTERGATIAFLAADSGLKYLSTDLWD